MSEKKGLRKRKEEDSITLLANLKKNWSEGNREREA